MKAFYSWNIINDNEFFKVIDKSVLHSKESGIPQEIRYLFDLQDEKTITLIYKDKPTKAKLSIKPSMEPQGVKSISIL